MYLKDVEIAKKVHILAPTNENIKQVIYLKSTKIGRQILKLFQKWYLILRYNIVSTRALSILSVQFNPTNFFYRYFTQMYR